MLKLDDAIRETLLDDIARGVARIDAEPRGPGKPHREPALWRIEVALLDDDGETLRVASLSNVLSWVVGRQHLDVDARDTRLDVARHAHLFLREERCEEHGCDGDHRDPNEAEAERRCIACNALLSEDSDYGDDTGQWEAECRRCRLGGDDEESDEPGDEDEVRAAVRKLGRDRIVALLAEASIECRDDESDDTLREALVVNVLDGTIAHEDVS